MKQIKRFPLHQNAKVFGVLTAVTSLIFVVPMFLIMSFAAPAFDQHGNPLTFPKLIIVLVPLFYLVLGYLGTVIGAAIYNLLFKYIGGFEVEIMDEDA